MKSINIATIVRRNVFLWLALGISGGIFAFAALDSDDDGWTDDEEMLAGTNPNDFASPWDSDGDGIPDYLEFRFGTDTLDPNDPPEETLAAIADFVPPRTRSRGNTAKMPATRTASESGISTLSDDSGDSGNSEDELSVDNWRCELSGSPPNGLTISKPTLTKTVSGPYEIYTAQFGFSGTAPYYENVFQGAFSFSMPGGNLLEIEFSSDDTATGQAARLQVQGFWFRHRKNPLGLNLLRKRFQFPLLTATSAVRTISRLL